MSARIMVRNLRDSGVLAAPPPAPSWHSTFALFCAATFAGAVFYLGAVYGVPALAKAVEKKPPPVTYARPE